MPKGGVSNRSVKALNVLPGQSKLGEKRFKFQTFQQLINRADISREVYRDTSKPLLEPADGAESFFQQYLADWSGLNLTEDYSEFAAEVYPLCQSLGQLLHYRKKVVQAVFARLERPGCTAYIALLDLLTHLARDLRDEFWPFFPDAVRAVTVVLDSAPDELVGATADAELFTSAFKTLAYLAKYLLRQLLEESDRILPIYRPLLGHAKQHVRDFAGESLAFLIRKIAQRHTNGKKAGGDLDKMLHGMFAFCTPSAEGSEHKDWDSLQSGVAMTLFESIKGVGNRLHSNGEMLILRLLKQCAPAVLVGEDPVQPEGMECRRVVTGRVLHRLCEHVRTEMAETVWSALHSEIEEAAAAWHNSDPATECVDGERRLEMLLKVLKEWTQRRLARTKVRDEEPEETAGDDSGDEGDGYFKAKNKYVDRQKQPIKLKPVVYDYDPCEEAERVWDSLQSVLRPDGSSRTMTPQLATSAMEATTAMLNVIRRFGEDQQQARKRCVAEMSAGGVWCGVLSTPNTTQVVIPRSAAYRFVHQVIQWDHFELVAPAVFQVVLAHVGAECEGEGGVEALSFFEAMSAACPEELRHENGRIQLPASIIRAAISYLQGWKEEPEKSSTAWLGLQLLHLAHPPKPKLIISAVEKFEARLIDHSPVVGAVPAAGAFAGTVTSPVRSLRAKCLQTLAGLCRDLQPKTVHGPLAKAAVSLAESQDTFACPATLEAAVDCVESVTRVGSKTEANPIEMHFERISHSLASPLRAVRLQAARLLRAIEELSAGQDTSDYEVLDKMVSVCETEINFQNSRELILDIQRIGHTTKLNKLQPRGRKAVPHFLVGVLKTKLSTMWTPASEVLIDEAGTQFDNVWPLLHTEVQEMQARHKGAGFMLRHKIDAKLVAEQESEKVEESDDKRSAEDGWVVQCRNELISKFLAVRSSDPTCTDYPAYHKTLWSVLENAHPLVERKNRVLVDFYLEFLEQYKRMWDDKDESNSDAKEDAHDGDDDDDDDDDGDDNDDHHTAEDENMVGVSKKLMNASLCDYLKLFATFQNPRSLKNSELVRSSYESLLTKAEPEIQQLALDCLLTFKDSKLGQYRETLSGIIDEKTFRSTLAMIKLAEEDAFKRRHGELEVKVVVVRKEDRPRLVPVLVRILYGKLLNRKGRRHAQQSLSIRRSTVMGFLSGLRPDELVHLFDVLLEPYKQYILTMSSEPNDCATMTQEEICARSSELLQLVPITRRTGVLKMMTDVVRQLATLVEPNLPNILRVQLGIAQAALHDLQQPTSSDDPKYNSQRARIVELRNLALKQIAAIFELFPSCDYSTFLAEFFVTVQPLVVVLPTEGMQAQHATPVLQALLAITSNDALLQEAAAPASISIGSTRKEMAHAIESLIACLDTPKIALTVLDTVLVCLLNILVADADNSTNHAAPFHSSLLERLRDRISRVVGTGTEKDAKKARSVVDTTLLKIISQLAKMTKDSTQLTAIGRMFVPFVKSNGLLGHDELMSVLSLFNDLVPQLQEPQYFSSKFARVLYTLQSKPARLAMVQVYTRLGESDQALKESVELLEKLNAYDAGRLGEYNYELRQEAYTKLLGDDFDASRLSMAQVLPLVYTFFHDIEDVDMSIRTSGASAITATVRAFKDVSSTEEGGNLIRSYIIPMLKIGLRKADELVRDEFVRLLGAVVRVVPEMYPDLLELTDDRDPEIDVLNNIVHIQMHRRVKALARLKSIVQDGRLTPGSMMGFLVPLITHYVYTKSVVVTKGGTRGGGDVVKQGGHNVVAGAIDVIGCICNKLPWGMYNRVLMQFLRTLTTKPDHNKQLIRLVCGIIDNFHFGKSGDVAALVPDEMSPADDDSEDDEHEDLSNSNMDGSKISAKNRLAVDTVVADRILPEIYRHLSKGDGTSSTSQRDTETDGQGVRHPIALAIVKLLQVLPATRLQTQLPRLINVLANSLKSHMQSIRDGSRKTLVRVISTLGPHYLFFAMEEMKGILLRGYQRHVLAYTTHALLAELAPVVPIGSLDHCFDSILPVLQDEIVGALSHEKEVDSLMKKTREYKVGKAYDSFKLLAQKVAFANLPQLLEPVRSVLAATTSLKVLQKVEEVLKRIAQGLLMNEDVTATHILTFCHRMIAQQQELGERKNELAVAKKRVYSEASGVVDDSNRNVAEDSELERQNAHYLTEFALGLLHVQVKRDGVDGFKLRNPDTVILIEPFVPQLLACLKSRENKVLELALKVIGLLVPCQLPAMAECAKALARRSFKVLGGAGDAHGLSQACYRCIAIILRDLPAADVTDHQLQVLLKFISTELDGAGQRGEQSTSFVLLKAIVSRKLVKTEVYDVMDVCFKLLVRSQSPSTRTNCSQLLLQFMLEYPLGPKRLQRHLDFIVKNLSYSLETGREAAMGMLNAIVVKFPQQVLLDQIDAIFLAVVARLVSDDSARCRTGAATLLQSIFKRTLADRKVLFEQLVEYGFQWYQNGDKPDVQRVAAQLMGLVVEVEGDSCQKRLSSWLPVMVQVLEDGSAAIADGEADSLAGDGWRFLYYTLRSLEKLAIALPGMLDGSVHRGGETSELTLRLWKAATGLLRHPHTWVKMLASRLFGLLFARCNPPEVGLIKGELVAGVALKLKGCQDALALRPVEEGLWTQLRSTHLDEKLAEQTVKDLLFVARAYHVDALANNDSSDARDSRGAANQPIDDDDFDDEDGDFLGVGDRSEFGRLFARFGRLSRATHRLSNASGNSNGVDSTREGDWVCVNCQNHNYATRFKCGRCHKDKGHTKGMTTQEAAEAQHVNAELSVAKAASKEVENLRRLCCLRWMAAASRLAADGPQGLTNQSHRTEQVIQAVFHLLPQGQSADGVGGALASAQASGFSESGVPPELAALAQDIAADVKSLVGPAKFGEAYSAVRARVMAVRQERKRKRVTEKVLDPQGAAKRKGKKNERKKMSRKRKVQQFKGLNGRDDKRGNKSRTTQQHSGKGEHSSAHF